DSPRQIPRGLDARAIMDPELEPHLFFEFARSPRLPPQLPKHQATPLRLRQKPQCADVIEVLRASKPLLELCVYRLQLLIRLIRNCRLIAKSPFVVFALPLTQLEDVSPAPKRPPAHGHRATDTPILLGPPERGARPTQRSNSLLRRQKVVVHVLPSMTVT